MSMLKLTVPALMILTGLCGSAPAQLSIPLVKTTYHVQVKYEMWRSGGSYWSTQFETSSLEEAEVLYELLLFALEEGSICEILGCSFDWIIVDVRIHTEHEWAIPLYDLKLTAPSYQEPSLYLRR